MNSNKIPIRVSSLSGGQVYEYGDGAVSVMVYVTRDDGTITGTEWEHYSSKADYEIAKLDKATEKLLNRKI